MRTNRANQDIRKEIVKHGLWMWQIASRLGIGEATLTRWMREELPEGDERRQRILAVLEDTQGGA